MTGGLSTCQTAVSLLWRLLRDTLLTVRSGKPGGRSLVGARSAGCCRSSIPGSCRWGSRRTIGSSLPVLPHRHRFVHYMLTGCCKVGGVTPVSPDASGGATCRSASGMLHSSAVVKGLCSSRSCRHASRSVGSRWFQPLATDVQQQPTEKDHRPTPAPRRTERRAQRTALVQLKTERYRHRP